MKPLDFALEEMRRVLEVLDALEVAGPDEREDLVEQLVGHRLAADRRVAALREQLEVAEGFAQDLRREINRQRKMTRNPA